MSVGKRETGSNAVAGYEGWWTALEGHLGGVYPFWDCNHPDFCSLQISDVIDRRVARAESVELDPAAIACKVGLPYLLGNRTLIQNVERAPWVQHLASPGHWELMPLPNHGTQRPDNQKFAARLVRELQAELEFYVEGASTVGILLSGGMDSRVVAGLLRKVQEENPGQFDVVALTWGADGTRDVVYAKRIAAQFGWSIEHFPITPETLRDNIELAGKAGAEVSPLHLHAMPAVADLRGIDVILAGSYGDSVGRAEFSGKRVSQLKSVMPRNIDPFGILKHSLKQSAVTELQRDLRCSNHFRANDSAIRVFEIEQEMHYMRRMLQSCMLHIAHKIPLYQMFTAPSVFGLMWQLAPEERGDKWYQLILKDLPGRLLDIPWARTGALYLDDSGKQDDFPKSYHSYGKWLREELKEEVVARVNSDVIRRLGIFNDRGLDRALSVWLKARTKDSNSLDEVMSWLASLHTFLQTYPVSSRPADGRPVADSIAVMRGSLYGQLYVRARNYFRE